MKIKPLDYVISGITIPNTSSQPIFLYDHVDMSPFHGEAFTVDTATVHEIIIKLCDGNNTLNKKLQSLIMCQDRMMG